MPKEEHRLPVCGIWKEVSLGLVFLPGMSWQGESIARFIAENALDCAFDPERRQQEESQEPTVAPPATPPRPKKDGEAVIARK